jgi:hypothetical protein
MTRGTKRITTAITATLMISGMAVACVAGVVASAPTAQAATDYAPGTVDNADPTPVMGWSSWSFTRFAGDLALDEAEANAMVSDGLTSVGYNYLNIDDGWYECPTTAGPLTDAYGRWIPWSSPEVIGGTTYPPPFPGSGGLNGIQVLANYVHGLGLKFGIYETMGISTNAVAAATPILEPGQTGLAGSQTTVPGETAASIGETGAKQANYNCGNQDVINYTGTGLTGSAQTAEEAAAQDYTDSVVDELASWGVDYIKLDGTGPSNGPDVEAWQAAIAQQSRPIVLNLTQGSFKAALAPTLSEYGNQWEEPGDIEINGPSEGSANACNVGSGFPLYAQTFTGCTDVFPLTSYSHWDNRFAFFGGSSTTASFEWFGAPGGFNDGDSIEVGDGAGTGVSTTSNSGMSQSAEETQLGLWSMGSAPLILGGDLSSSISNGYGTVASQNSSGLAPFDQSLLLNKEVIAADQSAEDAVQVSTSGSLASATAAGNQVFAKVLPNGDAYVALFNTSASTATPTASLSTTVSAINTAIGTFNSNITTKTAGATNPPPQMPTLAVDSNGYELQDLWGTDSLDTGGSLATGQYAGTISSAGSISATVPSEGAALFLVTPLSGAALTAPAITSSAGATFTAGTPGSFTVQTTGYPTAAITESGTLPSGVFFADNGNGTASLWGTPAASTGGVYPITITANNSEGTPATQNYTLTVDAAPVITSGSAFTMTSGASGTFTVQTTGYPTPSLSETGALPSGVTFTDNGNGTASLTGPGNSATPGTYNFTVNATNGVGSAAAQPFTLTILAQSPTPTTGNVAGTVTAAPGGAPLANICVYLYAVGNTSSSSGATCSLSNGYYELDEVAPGNYDVAFADPSGTYATQWYTGSAGGSPTQAGASAITVSAGAADTGINAAMAEVALGNVTGTVTAASGGASLQNICVYLYAVGNSSGSSGASCTLANGTYEIPSVASGNYDVAFADPSGTYSTQWYTGSAGGASTQSGAVAVTVPEGGQTISAINAAMAEVALGNVTGTVTAASGGASLQNICVYLYAVGNSSGSSGASCTLANGTYEIPSVPSGNYDVAFADPAGAYVTQWYTGSAGGASTQGAAVAIAVPSGGQTISGIGAAMAIVPTGNISGTVTAASGGAPLSNICVYLYVVGSSSDSYAGCTISNGTYDISGVAPGSYDVAFYDPSFTYATQWYTGTSGGSSSQSGATAVVIQDGNQTSAGINAAMAIG